MYINWLPTYSVEVEEIDEQHKKFVLLINDLYDAVDIGCEDIVLGDVLSQLSAYADYHFATEEKYFDQFNYANSKEHKEQHQAFRDKVATFCEEYEGKEKDYGQKILDFMKDWLTDHIITEDKAYTECFREHGLS